jgi:hypothetical protein
MTLNDLKKYNVIVDGGSGCIFQPMTNDYTYILTAKHLFDGFEYDDDGNEIPVSVPDGSAIKILQNVHENGAWQERSIAYTLIRGETFFSHANADAAILKIGYLENFDKIHPSISHIPIDSFCVHGFPNHQRESTPGNKDTSFQLVSLIPSGTNCDRAQLFNTTVTKENLAGMSGGGVLSIVNEHITILGVQSKAMHELHANGQIHFVPIEIVNEIISYPENIDKLEKLLPVYFLEIPRNVTTSFRGKLTT